MVSAPCLFRGENANYCRTSRGCTTRLLSGLWACGGGRGGQGGCRDQPIQTQATSLQHLTTNLAARQRSHSDDKLKDEKIKIKKSERAAQLLNRSQARICSQSGWWCIRGELGLHTLPPAAAGSHLIYSLWKAHSVGRAFPFWACEHIRCLLLM